MTSNKLLNSPPIGKEAFERLCKGILAMAASEDTMSDISDITEMLQEYRRIYDNEYSGTSEHSERMKEIDRVIALAQKQAAENEQLRAFGRECLARIDVFYGDKTGHGTYGLEPYDLIEKNEIHMQAKALGIEVQE